MNRKWDSKSKLEIVIAGLKGNLTISEICNNYGIGQSQYYKWRDEFFKHGNEIFETKSKDSERDRLKREVRKLKTIIGDLTTELKKNDYDD